MGLNLISKRHYNIIKNNINPNPCNYKILKYKYINNYLIILINYPDCKNFEGNKILIFKDIKLKELIYKESIVKIDPHFSNETKYSPIARFIPTKKGFEMAEKMCELI